jgi:putative transposase
VIRVHKIRLDPTAAQAVYFARACGTARFAYNWALAEWKRQYEVGGKPNEGALRKQLNAIKAAEFPWMAEVTKCAPQTAIKNVGLAFEHFFRRVKLGQKPGYPRFKRKGVRDSFRADNGPENVTSHAVQVVDKTVKLPRCGVVRMREALRLTGRVLSATVSRVADGWYVSLSVETEDQERLHARPAGRSCAYLRRSATVMACFCIDRSALQRRPTARPRRYPIGRASLGNFPLQKRNTL